MVRARPGTGVASSATRAAQTLDRSEITSAPPRSRPRSRLERDSVRASAARAASRAASRATTALSCARVSTPSHTERASTHELALEVQRLRAERRPRRPAADGPPYGPTPPRIRSRFHTCTCSVPAPSCVYASAHARYSRGWRPQGRTASRPASSSSLSLQGSGHAHELARSSMLWRCVV